MRAVSQIGRVRATLYTTGLATNLTEFPVALQPGTTWGSLRILESVGRGHFGDVYRAWDPTLDREVALKILRHRPAGAADEIQVIEEGRLMARVRHPNVVTIYGAQRIDGRTGLWMEFIQGRTLDVELRERGPVDAVELTRIGTELSSRGPVVPFDARDWVLVTAFDNRTGEAVLNGTVEHALEQELTESRFVNVVSRQRLVDTLELMQKSTERRPDPLTGREVALRDGQIRVLIAGRVESVGPKYAVTADILRPSDGSVVVSIREEARDAADLMRAMRALSLNVRAALGEMLSSIAAAQDALPQVTTPSLRALQLYAQALDTFHGSVQHETGAATERLLREALAEDPEFASAHILIAEAIFAQWTEDLAQRNRETWTHVQRARATSHRASEVERLYITGKSDQLEAYMQDPTPDVSAQLRLFERSSAAFEALLRLQPDHYPAISFLSANYRRLQRFDAARALRFRSAEVRLTHYGSQICAAQHALDAGDPATARAYVERAAALSAPQRIAESTEAWVRLFEAHEAWLRDAPEEALVVANAMEPEIRQMPPSIRRGQWALHLVSMYLTLGRLDDAGRVTILIPEYWLRDFMLSAVVAERGDRAALRSLLRERFSAMDRARRVGSLWVDAGLLG